MSKKKKNAVLQMSDIADLAGVSKSTVSRALADSPLVNDKTKNLIKEIAKQHNYRINTAASNFRTKSSMTIAVLLPSAKNAQWRLSDPFFLELLGAIAEAVDDHGHQLLLSRTSPQEGNWIEEFVDRRSSDGIILIGQGSQHESINEIAKHYKAISVWGAKVSEDQYYPVVGSDNQLGGFRAAEYLIKQGRKQIAFIGYNEYPETQGRYSGYQRALREYGLTVDDKLVPHNNDQDTYLTVSSLLESKIKFDAIVASSDLIAMACIRAIQESGRKVPEDIAVVGYDDIPLSAYYNPPITTIRQNVSIGGKILVDNLLEAIEGHQPEAILLDPKLVVRDSA